MTVFSKTKELSRQRSPKVSSEVKTLSERQQRSIERGRLFISCLREAIIEEVREEESESKGEVKSEI